MKLTGMMICMAGILIASSCFSQITLRDKVLAHVMEGGILDYQFNKDCLQFDRTALPTLYEVLENPVLRKQLVDKKLNKLDEKTRTGPFNYAKHYEIGITQRALYTIPRISTDSTVMMWVYEFADKTLSHPTCWNDFSLGTIAIVTLTFDTTAFGKSLILKIQENQKAGKYHLEKVKDFGSKDTNTRRLIYSIEDALRIQKNRGEGKYPIPYEEPIPKPGEEVDTADSK